MSLPANEAAAAWPPLDWRCARFETLTVGELQFIYRARQMVFSLEQQCIYLDADGLDERAWHIAAWTAAEREPLAYARLLEPGVKYDEASLGRVITTAPGRGIGLGRELVRRAIVEAGAIWPGSGLRISAQSRLESFYGGFGFAVVGARYLEDGIEHTEMLRPATLATGSA